MDLQVHNRWHGWEWLFFFFFLLLCNGFHIHLSGSQINFSFVLSSHISIHMFHINPHRSLHQAPLRLLSTAEQFVLPANLALQICLNENLKQLCVATFWNVFFFFLKNEHLWPSRLAAFYTPRLFPVGAAVRSIFSPACLYLGWNAHTRFSHSALRHLAVDLSGEFRHNNSTPAAAVVWSTDDRDINVLSMRLMARRKHIWHPISLSFSFSLFLAHPLSHLYQNRKKPSSNFQCWWREINN